MKHYDGTMIEILLMECENPGNIGAVARVMKNFDYTRLVLVEPRASKKSVEAKKRAKNAQDVLSKAMVVKKGYLKRYDYLIGTTALMGSDYNIRRAPLLPEQLAERLANKALLKKRIGILFGRESSGLTTAELELCDFAVNIPCSRRYGTLNLSQSVGIICYELFRASGKPSSASHINFAGKKEKEHLLRTINQALDRMHFTTKEKRETQRRLWKRFVGKGFMTVREVFSMHGFFRKVR